MGFWLREGRWEAVSASWVGEWLSLESSEEMGVSLPRHREPSRSKAENPAAVGGARI